jgi:hypothetical protein
MLSHFQVRVEIVSAFQTTPSAYLAKNSSYARARPMSIWTELLFLHGHIATPTALALITQACAAPPAAPEAARTPGTAAPATATAQAPRADAATGEPIHHPLRTVGQLR